MIKVTNRQAGKETNNQLTQSYSFLLKKQLTDKQKDKWRKDRKLTNKQQTIAGYNFFA
jgi:hypothetical protein